MLIDTRHPAWFFDGGYMNLSELRRALHMGFHNTLRILEVEGIHVDRLQ